MIVNKEYNYVIKLQVILSSITNNKKISRLSASGDWVFDGKQRKYHVMKDPVIMWLIEIAENIMSLEDQVNTRKNIGDKYKK